MVIDEDGNDINQYLPNSSLYLVSSSIINLKTSRHHLCSRRTTSAIFAFASPPSPPSSHNHASTFRFSGFEMGKGSSDVAAMKDLIIATAKQKFEAKSGMIQKQKRRLAFKASVGLE
ncbi:hypothetical protein QVD17_09348 [Tagetes erecta]|uniref:Uncharacterized protein n=1 Tax=Tagetes erecta TaxID=13708 RepID=A0AAD8P583_TARER|nr:hypothetical protein QVD17_09348 [Tagetes erecta]